MSKFFITNNSVLFKKIQENVDHSEYKTAFQYSKGDVYAITTKKLAFDNQNGTERGGGFAVVTGTMAWREGEPVNAVTLEDVFDSFNGDVDSIRQNAIGNYAASIYKDGVLLVFGEVSGFYNIYYYNVDNTWLVSNSLYEMAVLLREKLTIDTMNIIESTMQDGILWGGTYFHQITRLNGFDHIKIDRNGFRHVIKNYNYPLALSKLEEKVRRYKELSISYAHNMAKAYGKPTIAMTGGLDARMVLASNLAAEQKPDIYYGTGNSFITNTHEEDKQIDEIYSSKFGLNFQKVSWDTPDYINRFWDKYLNLYGFQYELYAASDSVMESMLKSNNQMFQHGQGGELLRNLPWIESRSIDYFTLDEYLMDFYVTPRVRKDVIKVDEYIKHIRGKLEQICKYYDLDINHIANEDVFFLSLERRKTADAIVINCVNFMKYCSYQLVEYENMKVARVGCKDMENSKYMLLCLDAICPDILDVPVFSHQTMREFHRETMSLSSQVKPTTNKEKIKKFVKRYLPLLVKIHHRVNGVKRIWRFDEDGKYYKQTLSLYNEYDNYRLLNYNEIEDARRLVHYVMKVYALNSLNVSSINSSSHHSSQD